MTKGQVLLQSFQSQVLKSNPLKDPSTRQLAIYLPPGYEKSTQTYPVLFLLSGFTGSGFMMLNREPFSEAIDQRLDRLILKGKIKPMVVVMPDCFTYYGGSQYLDSPALGNYETHLIKELVPYVKRNFQVKSNREAWALAGKSSGGYGSLILGMRHSDLFGVVACHSGDMGFEYCYQPDFPETLIELEKHGGIASFMKHFYSLKKKSGNSFLTLNILAMAAAYSPNPKVKPHLFDLPFDSKTAAILPAIWKKWLAWDPVHLCTHYKKELKRLKLLVDCGTRDEFRLYAGARIFSERLKKLGIPHVYEEFDDTHMKINYRYDRSLDFVSQHMR